MAIYHHISLVPTPSGVMPVYIASPEGPGPHPAILVIAGMSGPGTSDFLAAERLADAGFVGVVPDLFHRGPVCLTPDELQHRRRQMQNVDTIADIDATIEHLRQQRFIADRFGIMGFCMGGCAAAEIAAINTRRFSKLVLVDSVGIKVGGPFDRDIADVFATSAAELTGLSWHDSSKARDPSSMTDEELQIFASDRIAHGLYTWEPYMHNPKLPYRLHRIDIPTLLIWGAGDGIVTPTYGKAFRDMIPGATMVVIPDAAHSPHVEQPEAFAKAFLEFASK